MEAKSVAQLPSGAGWQFEPKWDGFRCLAFKADGDVELRGKSGKSLSRYFPEVIDSLQRLPHARMCLDGELVIPQGNHLSFDALQMRLHPAASRIRKLADATPALLIAFDCLLNARGAPFTQAPLLERRDALEKVFARISATSLLRLSPYTRDRAQATRWLNKAGGFLDGVIAKRLDGAYLSGERAMQKIKRLETADCVVGGFRYGSGSKEVASLLLGLYDDDGLLHHVGFTSAIPAADRHLLTRRLEKLVAPPGFTGNAPGGPSRWSTERSTQWQPLKPRLVVEVCYDHVTAGRFRHGTRLMRWRPDKAPHQCTCDQLRPPAKRSALLKRTLRAT
jgi:ATP-dependent DNA ligase